MQYKIVVLTMVLFFIVVSSYSNSIVLGKSTKLKITIQEEKAENFTFEHSPYIKFFFISNKLTVFKVKIMNNSENFYSYATTNSTLSLITRLQLLQDLKQPLYKSALISFVIACCGGCGVVELLDQFNSLRFSFTFFYLCLSGGTGALIGSLLGIPLTENGLNYFLQNKLFTATLCVHPHELSEKFLIVKQEDLYKEYIISFASEENNEIYTYSFKLPVS